MTPRRLPYNAQFEMDDKALSSFAERGGRFRNRGATAAVPKIGLTSGSIDDPVRREADTARSLTAWGRNFGSNSVYGSRPGPGDAYGTAANPLKLSPIEGAAITARKTGIAQTNQPFMPNASGDAAGLARNRAMTQPGGMAQYQEPDEITREVIGDIESYHRENGIPLPEMPARGVASNEDILRKYQTPGTTANTTYASKLAML